MNKKIEIDKIFDSISSHRDFSKAIDAVEKLQDDSDEVFELLWKRAIKAQSKGGHVFISALTLYKLNIKCPLSPQEAIRQMCDDWEVSIEEVPSYLAKQFSKKVILELIDTFNFKTEDQNARLETIAYWVKIGSNKN